MDTDKAIDRLRELGYEVGVAFEGHGGDREDGGVPTVYRVEGHGVSLQLAHDDEDAWASFTNEKAHEHREKSARASDPEDDFEWTPEEQMESSLEAAVATGAMERKDATKAIKEFRESQEAA
jgi:hypothetical protein